MRARMENLIKDIITYCNTNYPGVVVSWDVVDDPINSGDRHEKKYRESSNWYKTLGEDYMYEAFALADKYATKEQKLFVAQEAIHEKNTREPFVELINLFKENCRIDGIAVQTHYTATAPNVFDLEDMFKAMTDTGLEIVKIIHLFPHGLDFYCQGLVR